MPAARAKANAADQGKFPPYKVMEVASIAPHERNPRLHSAAQVRQIAASISQWGFTNPVLVDERNGLIAGHGRLLAAQLLGMGKVPAIVLSGLSKAERQALVIADNKLALNASWNDELLLSELGELSDVGFDLGLTGFGEDEIAALLPIEPFDDGKAPPSSARELDPDGMEMGHRCPRCGFEFDKPV